MPRDVLEEILHAALLEKATAAESVAEFAAGLRDRARLILAERLRPVEERVRALEKENAWRATTMDGLADEVRGLKDENERLKDEGQRVKDENARVKDENGRLKDESRRLQEEAGRLKEEIEGLRAEWRTASAAHDRLLGHHRSVLRAAAESLAAVSSLPVWKRGQARARLADLEAVLRRDTA